MAEISAWHTSYPLQQVKEFLPNGDFVRYWRRKQPVFFNLIFVMPEVYQRGRLIAGMAEAYYVPIAPHNPMGPISLASGLQLAASIPNFLVQEQVSLGEGYLKKPFKLQADGTVMIP
jgi:hypothetical protein